MKTKELGYRIKNIFKTKKFELDVYNPDYVLFSIYNRKLANKFNEYTGKFKGYKFKAGEEVMFRVKLDQIRDILVGVGLDKDLAQQIEIRSQKACQIEYNDNRADVN